MWPRSGLGHALDKAGQHSFDFVDLRLQSLELLGSQKVQVSGQKNVILKLACRTECDVKELAQFGIGALAAAFRNISGDGKGGPPHLTGETEDLMPWENSRESVQADRKSMAFLPDFQFAVVLHDCTREIPFCMFTYNLRLKTGN